MPTALKRIILLAVISTVSCTASITSNATEQVSRGQEIYQQNCATEICHGVNGEGIYGENGFRDWPLVGEVFQRRNPTAQVVFDIVRSGGEPNLRGLSDQQVYDAIAYELSLNGIMLNEPLDAQNAPFTSSGAKSANPKPGSLFPAPRNASLVSDWPAPFLPILAENEILRLRLTQIAQASSIGNRMPPNGGSFIIAVFSLEDLTDHPIEVAPQQMRMFTLDGKMLEPLDIDLAFPVSRFYPQAIEPEHGTAATAVFTLPAGTQPGYLGFTLPDGQTLSLELTQ